MTDNAITTHDDASSYATQLVKMLSFDHEGAAGSTQFTFGAAQTTQHTIDNSATSALVDDGVFGGSSGAGTSAGGSGQTGGSTGDGGSSGGNNALTTSDHAENYTSQWAKIFTFTHEGAAGSTGLSLGESGTTHATDLNSATSALVSDAGHGTSGGDMGGTGSSGSGSTGAADAGSTGSGDAGSGASGSGGGNLFTTGDHAITFDQDLMKSLNFAHDGAAGQTDFGFGTSQTVHWESAQSDTSSLFSDGLFGGLTDALSHGGSGSALIG